MRSFLLASWMALSAAVATPVAAAAANAEPTAPIVYTGELRYAHGKATHLARLFMLKRQAPGASAPATAAFLMLYMGRPGSPEYVGLYYDPAAFNPDTHEILLQRNDDTRGRRLPTVRLRLDEASGTLSGPFHSQTEGYQGELVLKQGWEEPAAGSAAPLDGIGGIYDAQCDAKDGSALHLEELELIPSRIFAERMAPEGAFMQTNYLGSGLCPYTGPTLCVSFTSGVYNFYTGKLSLMQGAWRWDCDRRGHDTLSCTSPRYPRCLLTRRQPATTPSRATPRYPAAQALSAPVPTVASGIDCQAWEGTYVGSLRHHVNGRVQPVSLRLTAFPTGAGPGAKCLVNGSASLHFALGNTGWEKITYPIPQFEMDAGQARQVLFSDNYTDAVLDVRRTADGGFTGQWYSRLFGLVGQVDVKAGSQYPSLDARQLIPGIGGQFTLRSSPQRSVNLITTEAGFDKTSHDPYMQLAIGGAFRTRVDTTGYPRFVSDGVQIGSYDFFTNFLVVRTGGSLYYGDVSLNGVTLRGQPRGHLAIGHPLETEYMFDRTGGPAP